MIPMIDINQVSKSYGNKKALNNVSLKLDDHKIVGLLGPNGAGKTTLIKVLVGLLNDYEGNVFINGNAIGKKTKAIVSYLPDESYLYRWMSVKDSMTLFDDMYDDFSLDKCESMLANMQIDLKTKIKNLSKGNQEKVQFALVMSRAAKVYILDEPIAGVDPASRLEILNLIQEHRHPESLVILSTHLITDIEKVFDEIIFIKDGEIILHDERTKLVEEHNQSINDLFIEVFKK